jgi:hypothetical protein
MIILLQKTAVSRTGNVAVLEQWSVGVMEKIQYSSTPTLPYSGLYQTISLFSLGMPTDSNLFWTPMALNINCIDRIKK